MIFGLLGLAAICGTAGTVVVLILSAVDRAEDAPDRATLDDMLNRLSEQ